MKRKGFTVYAERDNGVITTVSTYKTRQLCPECMNEVKEFVKTDGGTE